MGIPRFFELKPHFEVELEMTDSCNIKITDPTTKDFFFLNVSNPEFNQFMDKMARKMVELGILKESP